MEVCDALRDVERHPDPGLSWERHVCMLGNELPDAAQRSKLEAERVDAGTLLFEAEALEYLRVATEVPVDGGLPDKVVLALVSANVVRPVSSDLVALQDRLVVGFRDVACGPKPQQFVRHAGTGLSRTRSAITENGTIVVSLASLARRSFSGHGQGRCQVRVSGQGLFTEVAEMEMDKTT
ncbi:uncharacterized protein SPSK_01999 [Sporothrix schenckii 1099-18]|uniref:Uncharacterized protein n=1 Tax=Sporothrix schenckii 1099-18 TaxID=1397361 RepID=A0A0F2MF97_SPOSC|nr:uncharacterized protein SPSK_01999 [Sporothrix schenckii 1099-18]KJR87500.1 hypothetical protein SPSK_01999 [Sporothrix schenckii 1099-18]